MATPAELETKIKQLDWSSFTDLGSHQSWRSNRLGGRVRDRRPQRGGRREIHESGNILIVAYYVNL